jgi:hypothetical protein
VFSNSITLRDGHSLNRGRFAGPVTPPMRFQPSRQPMRLRAIALDSSRRASLVTTTGANAQSNNSEPTASVKSSSWTGLHQAVHSTGDRTDTPTRRLRLVHTGRPTSSVAGVRLSIAERRPLWLCATCGVTALSRSSITKSPLPYLVGAERPPPRPVCMRFDQRQHGQPLGMARSAGRHRAVIKPSRRSRCISVWPEIAILAFRD